MTIGFFDSGIGGLTVLKEALQLLPQEDYVYYADTENVPYGTKSREEVRQHIFNAVNFINQYNINALVVACNTATSIAIRRLRQLYDFPIIGMEPAVKPAVNKTDDKRVLVLATPLTIQEDKYKNLVSRIDARHIVDSLALPELVNYAENFIFNDKLILTYLKKKLAPFDLDDYGTIVLGCTHFIYYREIFKQLAANIDIIDGNYGTVVHLRDVLADSQFDLKQGSGEVRFYSSGKEEIGKYKKYMRVLNQYKINK
ncbi:glutamate racemase [Halocella sp. SP3-1]|uniref:glutamate racemase n=1 Tax=Halocella sp. SP3-1 TaxID=2382161 RepID=UPI000F7577D0|nr:glutamate racemase [Halocella sp. SP3-1]AZO94335.1 glutamate racemase [Halocella sp. SP3-1]